MEGKEADKDSFVFELQDNEIEIANLPNLATLCKRKTRDDRCGRNKGKLIWEHRQRLKTTILSSTFTLNHDTGELTSRKIP